jgi:hypothetical protein
MKRTCFYFIIASLSAWGFGLTALAAPADAGKTTKPVPAAQADKSHNKDNELDRSDDFFPTAKVGKGPLKFQGLGKARPLIEKPPAATASLNAINARKQQRDKTAALTATRVLTEHASQINSLTRPQHPVSDAVGGPRLDSNNRAPNAASIGGPARLVARNSAGVNGTDMKRKP